MTKCLKCINYTRCILLNAEKNRYIPCDKLAKNFLGIRSKNLLKKYSIECLNYYTLTEIRHVNYHIPVLNEINKELAKRTANNHDQVS